MTIDEVIITAVILSKINLEYTINIMCCNIMTRTSSIPYVQLISYDLILDINLLL